jgi:hypothetical protein
VVVIAFPLTIGLHKTAMRIRWQVEADEWTTDGRKINSPENLELIRKTLEDEGPIIVEHWFYYGSSAPDRFVFDDYDEFVEYLEGKAWAGDAIHVWSFAAVCKDENELASGKCPDDSGRVPKRGAY